MPFKSSSSTSTSSSSSTLMSSRPPTSYSTYQRQSSYKNTSASYSSSSSSSSSSTSTYSTYRSPSVASHLRSTSLDRSISVQESPTSTYRRPSTSAGVTSTSSRPVTSRPPRGGATISSILSNTTGSSSTTPSTSTSSTYLAERSKRLENLPASLDIKARISYLRSNSSLRRTVAPRGCDALHDCHTSPVLTNYRHLGEHGGSRRSSLVRRPSLTLDRTSDQLDSIYSSSTNLRDYDSGHSSSSSSGSSSPSFTTGVFSKARNSQILRDENLNYLRYKYDSNHNLCPSSSSSAAAASATPLVTSKAADDLEDSGGGSSSSSSGSGGELSPPSRHSRYGSGDDVTSPYSSSSSSSSTIARRRRTSGGSGQASSTSGYSSDASSSSGGGSSPGSSVFRRDRQENGGVLGLRNLGNTCFMNSVIQCLSNTRPLLEYCLREGYISDINTSISSMKGALFKAFADLLHSMWKTSNDESAVNPQAFKSQIQKFAPRFMGYSQQDAQEFLRYLLQGLHEDVNRVTAKPTPLSSDIDDNLSDDRKASESWRRYLRFDDSKIVDLFVGQLKSTLRCTVCGHTSVTFDPFWDLSLPIPKSSGSVKLSQCFDLFTREEVLDGDEKPTCSKCKTRRKCTKSFTVQKFPKILVIHLKRFSPSEKYKAKLSTNVDFPLNNLDLGVYLTNGSRGQNCMYNLYGVSNHSGSVYTGHYTAYSKHPYSGDWHDFNDSRTSKVQTSGIVSSEAYVLFYEQVAHNSRL